ncbi:MAG: hypothetical protein DLM55_00810 [Acidimicrobiales bacterium]|nr:MAG: hypothetical protein DLM55_00810 [Acidimicrobiales bacterium]
MTRQRLLLDEMYSNAIAEQLIGHGHDVQAVCNFAQLVGCPDEDIVEYAGAQSLSVLTENIREFEVIRRRWEIEGRTCPGLLYASAQRFPRDRRFIANLINALDHYFTAGDIPNAGQVQWLTRSHEQ